MRVLPSWVSNEKSGAGRLTCRPESLAMSGGNNNIDPRTTHPSGSNRNAMPAFGLSRIQLRRASKPQEIEIHDTSRNAASMSAPNDFPVSHRASRGIQRPEKIARPLSQGFPLGLLPRKTPKAAQNKAPTMKNHRRSNLILVAKSRISKSTSPKKPVSASNNAILSGDEGFTGSPARTRKST